jgi:hypothetical protein
LSVMIHAGLSVYIMALLVEVHTFKSVKGVCEKMLGIGAP